MTRRLSDDEAPRNWKHPRSVNLQLVSLRERACRRVEENGETSANDKGPKHQMPAARTDLRQTKSVKNGLGRQPLFGWWTPELSENGHDVQIA